MKIMEVILDRKRLFLMLTGMLSLVGAIMWVTMVRQEDPRLPDFWGQVISVYPGADAPTVERLVLEPIEDALAEVEEIKQVEATAYNEMAVLIVELRGDTKDFDLAWDKVRRALASASLEFPEGARAPSLDDKMQDQDSVVLAVTGSSDLLKLLNGARILKDALLSLPDVSRVSLIADPGEQVTVALDDETARRYGINAVSLSQQLSARNRILPGGSLHLGGKTVRLKPLAEFSSTEEIAETPVMLQSGASFPLNEIARVHLGPKEPTDHRMRFNGEMSVGLAIVPKKQINLVDFGDTVRERIARTIGELKPLKVHEVCFQPKRTRDRLDELGQSLLFGSLIVGGLLLFTMGIRMGLLVASVIPLVAFSSLALFSWSGGALHQISIAAFVFALGMIVDNAIVVAENIQWRLDQGESASQAAIGAVRELAVPLAGATGTTLAAFFPMLIAEGPTAAFTQTIPIILMITLTVSYFIAVFVTPALSGMVLRPGKESPNSFVVRIGGKLGTFAVGRPVLVIAIALVLVAGSLVGIGNVKQQFFPTSDRNQMVVDIKLPEGAHLDTTDAAVRVVEKEIASRNEVTQTASFIGRSAPQFYYNIISVPFSPHFAQIIVETTTTEDLNPLLKHIRSFVKTRLPEVKMVARKLEQGPPIKAPVEIRLTGKDLGDLENAATMVSNELRSIKGTEDIRHDLGPGAPTIRFTINDAAAGRFGLTRADLAFALYGRTRGLPMGELRSGDDPIPVVVRSSAGEMMPVENLESVSVPAPDGRLIPLAQIATEKAVWQPAAIKHFNGVRVATVSSQLTEGHTFSDVLKELTPRLKTLDLPANVEFGFGGDAEGSGEANTSLLKSFPIGILLLIGVLLAEFNSFRRTLIILVTVPLAAAGIVPGLLIGNQPFGFMSMLGVIALVGIVVNNAIVLLEVVEERKKQGADVNEALTDAVSRRIRPILLTSGTTVVGLLPLAFSSSTLWPPLASTMISGLIASTMLTLVVVPAIYRLMFNDKKPGMQWIGKPLAMVSTAVLMVTFCVSQASGNTQIDVEKLSGEIKVFQTSGGSDDSLRAKIGFQDAMRLGGMRPAVKAANDLASAAEHVAIAERRAALWPVVGVSTEYTVRDRSLAMETPIGEFPMGEKTNTEAGVKIIQPLLDPARLFYSAPAAKTEAEGKRLEAERVQRRTSAYAAYSFLNVHAIDARIDSTSAYIESLESRLRETGEKAHAGLALEADVLKVRLAYDKAKQNRSELVRMRDVAIADLARATNLPEKAEPDAAPDMLAWDPPPSGDAIKKAVENRSDLAAMQKAVGALEKRRSAVGAESWPKLEASVTWAWNENSPYTENEYVQGAVSLKWTPFEAGTRGPRSAAFSANIRAMKNELDEAKRQVEIEVKSAIASIENAREAFHVAERGVEQAAETLRMERVRRLEGRSTTNDLLEAEAQLRENRTMRELSRLDVTQSWVKLWEAHGAELH